jgi:enoyl-CoA hydratase/carnithine racemase
MTWAMYERWWHLRATGARGVVALRFPRGRPAGFVAGTDIGSSSRSGARTAWRTSAASMPASQLSSRCRCRQLAVVEGWASAAASPSRPACDFRLATPGTKFGVPIARTLGNCLSMANVARLVAAFGRPRVQRCCCWRRC